MRIAVLLLASLTVSAAIIGAVGEACAGDAPLFYAPGAMPVGPYGLPRRPMMGMPMRPGPMMGGMGPRPFVGGGGMPLRPGPGGPMVFDGPRGRVCFNPAETREKIAAHGLTEPFRALRIGRLQGEALRARLCRWKQDKFVYEIAVLRRDGRIVRIYMDARNGQNVGPFGDPDRP